MNHLAHKNITVFKAVGCAFCISLALSFYAQAGGRTNLANADEISKRAAADDNGDGTQQTLNLNFSPTHREKLRRALDDYARSVDPDHNQIEERRRAMQESIEARFFAADKDNDGSLDRQEATESLPQVARHFSTVDTDQNELITLDELENAQARIMERRKAAEAALEAQKQQDAEAAVTVKRKNKQASSTNRKNSL